jgi:hypothetical protein
MKTDNRPHATAAKLQLRRLALDHVGAERAHVLDVYCGVSGVMHDGAWCAAESYAGIDKAYDFKADARRRFVGDSLRVLRNLDLSRFNVFDVDAYGDPFPALTMIARRRRWAPGELGAFVIAHKASSRGSVGSNAGSLRMDYTLLAVRGKTSS